MPTGPKEQLRNCEIQGCLPCAGGDPPAPQKRVSQRLARPRKRHYTFARRYRDHFTRVRGRRTAPSPPLSVDVPGICLLSKRNGDAPTGRSWRSGRFSSLRLSVRTPPFHGGESGSIPLGSANTLPPPLIAFS